MKKVISVFLAALVLVSMLATVATAVPEGPNHGKAPKVTGIVMDGTKDAGYNNGLVIEFSRVAANVPAENILQGDLKKTGATGKMTFVWDTGFLYAYVEIKDENTGYEYTKEQFAGPALDGVGGNQTNFENIAFIVDFKNDGKQAELFRINYFNYLCYLSRTINAAGTQSDVAVETLLLDKAIGKYEQKAQRTDTGWTAEVKIPLGNLAAGAKIGVFGQLTDRDNAGVSVTPVNTAWFPHTEASAGAWMSPKYGYIELSADAKATQGITTPAVQVTTTAAPTTTAAVTTTTTAKPATTAAAVTTTTAKPVTTAAVTTAKASAAKTGDDSVIFLMAAGFILAGALIVVRRKAVAKN